MPNQRAKNKVHFGGFIDRRTRDELVRLATEAGMENNVFRFAMSLIAEQFAQLKEGGLKIFELEAHKRAIRSRRQEEAELQQAVERRREKWRQEAGRLRKDLAKIRKKRRQEAAKLRAAELRTAHAKLRKRQRHEVAQPQKAFARMREKPLLSGARLREALEKVRENYEELDKIAQP
jgi:hypothetical protein